MTEHVVILSRKEALRRAGGISKVTERRLAKSDPDFPQRVQITPGRIGYYEHEWDAWLEQRRRSAS